MPARSASGTRRPARPARTPSSAAAPTPACWAATAASIRRRRRMSAPGSRPSHRPPSIQKTQPDGKVEILVTEADGVKFDGPNDLTFGAGRPALFHQFRRLGPGRRSRIPAASSSSRRTAVAHDPRGTRPRLSERHRRRAGRLDRLGRVLHAAASSAASPTARKTVHRTRCRRAHPRRPEDRRRRQFLDHGGGLRRRRRPRARTASTLDFLETGGTILNCCFGKGGKLFCCDMGPFDTTGRGDDRPADRVDVGVEGMPLFRGAIG